MRDQGAPEADRRSGNAQRTVLPRAVASRPSIEDRIAIAQARLCRQRPLLAPMVQLARMIEDDRVPWMGIDSRARIYWNRASCSNLSVADLTGLLFHEVLHLLLRHPERGQALQNRHPDWTRALLNLAADLEVNDLLDREGVIRPGSRLDRMLITPRSLQLPSGWTMEEYAEWLQKEQPPRADTTPEDSEPDDEASSSSEADQEAPASTGPDIQASTATGQDHPESTSPETPPGDATTSGLGRGTPASPEPGAPVEVPGGTSTLRGYPGGSGHGLPPEPWERLEDDETLTAPEEAIQQAREVCGHLAGTATGPIADRLHASRTPHVPWTRVLARILRGHLQGPPIPGGVPEDHAYIRVHPASPDPFLFPSLCGRRRRIGVVLDVSGSMQILATRAMGEVMDLVSQPDTEVLMVCCDTQVIWKGTWHRGMPIPWSWMGTDLRPAIDDLVRDRPAAIVVITDGITPWADRPPSVPVIVCRLGRYGPPLPPWCQEVVVDNPNELVSPGGVP